VESNPSPRLPQHQLQNFPSQTKKCLGVTFTRCLRGAKKEGMNFYLGAFLACANSWRDPARAKASELSALQALKKECASLKEEKRCWERQEEAYKDSLKMAQKAKEEANKRLYEAG